MGDAASLIEQAPLQDRDLLQRLNLYFDALDTRLRQGEGWFIFNAHGGRSGRITAFIQRRIGEARPDVSAFVIPWRDFALSAYVQDVGLPELAPAAQGTTGKAHDGYELASRLTQETFDRMVGTDILVLTGLKPAHTHEARLLDRTLDNRYRQRLATILLTPDMPQELEAEFETLDPTRTYWDRLFSRMYETSLVAI
jgi:hypothetical protein